MFYFFANLVFGVEEEESEFCTRRWAELVQARELWENECWKTHVVKMPPCCVETASYLEKRYKEYTNWCPIVGKNGFDEGKHMNFAAI